MLNRKLSIIFLAITLTFFTACSTENEANDILASKEYVLTTTDNEQIIVKESDSNGFVVEGADGKVILFDIFATWCPPCQASAAHLTSLQEKYKDKLLVIGTTVERPEFTKEGKIINDKIDSFRLKYNAKYKIVNSDQNMRLNNAIATSLKLGNRYPIPTVALFKDGKYINHYVGSVQEEFIESDIKRALEL
jgi:thiol-disulfide isomerase/thioredoxin